VLAKSIATSLAFILTRPVPLKARVPLAFASVLVLALFLPFYALFFVGIVFGDWL